MSSLQRFLYQVFLLLDTCIVVQGGRLIKLPNSMSRSISLRFGFMANFLGLRRAWFNHGGRKFRFICWVFLANVSLLLLLDEENILKPMSCGYTRLNNVIQDFIALTFVKNHLVFSNQFTVVWWLQKYTYSLISLIFCLKLATLSPPRKKQLVQHNFLLTPPITSTYINRFYRNSL